MRVTTAYPIITHLRMDPYEIMRRESGMYFRWFCDNIWIFIPIGERVAEFVKSLYGISLSVRATAWVRKT